MQESSVRWVVQSFPRTNRPKSRYYWKAEWSSVSSRELEAAGVSFQATAGTVGTVPSPIEVGIGQVLVEACPTGRIFDDAEGSTLADFAMVVRGMYSIDRYEYFLVRANQLINNRSAWRSISRVHATHLSLGTEVRCI